MINSVVGSEDEQSFLGARNDFLPPSRNQFVCGVVFITTKKIQKCGLDWAIGSMASVGVFQGLSWYTVGGVKTTLHTGAGPWP